MIRLCILASLSIFNFFVIKSVGRERRRHPAAKWARGVASIASQSFCQPAAVDVEILPGDEARGVGSKEHGESGNFVWLTPAP